MKFQGKIDAVIFENDRNFFKILSVQLESSLTNWLTDTITVTGSFGEVTLDASYEFEGTIVDNPKYGQQFKCDAYKMLMPHEESSVIKYLSSDDFPGIGKKSATKIVHELGSDAIEKIKADPSIVNTLTLSGKQKGVLKSEISAMDNFSQVILELTKLGLTKRLATLMYQKFQGETLNKVKENPYTLISSIVGFGFKTADQVGRNLGIERTDQRRLQGALLQVLEEAYQNEGSTFVPNADLLKNALAMANENVYGANALTYEQLVLQLNKLQELELVMIEGETTFLVQAYKSEWEIAQQLKLLTERKLDDKKFTDSEVKKVITKVEKQLKITYDQTQKDAIKNALTNPIFLLTGGPGTGKTTIISGILLAFRHLYEIPDADIFKSDTPFLLAAPTGRAAKRMSEATGVVAKTIHRMLGIGRDGNYSISDLNELNGKVLIVDEMSMVDMQLFKQLIMCIDSTPHIIFVGDRDQLPSVGAGNIFADLIDSDIFVTTKLAQIHRQSGDSSIIDLAYDINRGDELSFSTKSQNTSFIECAAGQIQYVIPQVVARSLQKGFQKDDLQVLGAMYKTSSGVEYLNQLLQDQLNPLKDEKTKVLEYNDHTYRIGDRVLQLVNNPDKDIYNGQIGKIIALDLKNTNEIMTVDFEGNEVTFSKIELNDLTLAYAITIHKSQGSEFPVVILSLTMQNYRMLRRNLLYTGVTRARDFLILVGEAKAFKLAIKTAGDERNTALVKRLGENFGKKVQDKTKVNAEVKDIQTEETITAQKGPYILTKELIVKHLIDPLIGVENDKIKNGEI